MKWIWLLIFLPLGVAGQQLTAFWEPIEGLPNKEQTAYFTLATDEHDQLLAGTDKGLFATSDLGKTWKSLLSSEAPIIKIVIDASYTYAISADNVIYVSDDEGDAWQAYHFNELAAITDFLVLDDESLLLSTGYVEVKDDVGYFRGKGLFKSADHGETWTKIDLGLAQDHFISHLAKDSQGRIYASLDEYYSRDGAILYTQNLGETWEKLPPVLFNWGQEDDLGSTAIVKVSSMEVDQSDSLVIGMLGATGNVATSVNLINSFEGAMNSAEWKHMQLVPFGYAWFYLEAQGLFFPTNGGTFAFRIGQSNNLDGVYHAMNRDIPFDKRPVAPVYLGEVPNFTKCSFAETADGRVFMVQELDRVIYYTDIEREPLHIGEMGSPIFKAFPSPFTESLHIEFDKSYSEIEVSVYGLEGALLHQASLYDNDRAVLKPEVSPGTYILQAWNGQRAYRIKIVKY